MSAPRYDGIINLVLIVCDMDSDYYALVSQKNSLQNVVHIFEQTQILQREIGVIYSLNFTKMFLEVMMFIFDIDPQKQPTAKLLKCMGFCCPGSLRWESEVY